MDVLVAVKDFSLGPVILSHLLLLYKEGVLRINTVINDANDTYADILINKILDGEKASVPELNQMRRMVALRFGIHDSRMAGIAEVLARGIICYMANSVHIAMQKKQFLYNLKVYGQKYEDIQKSVKNTKICFLIDWGWTAGFVYLVWIADVFLVENEKLSCEILSIAAVFALFFSGLSVLLSRLIIYLRWERGKKQREESAREFICELCAKE